jgi:Leucine-rich repeat (LRR) protein
LSRNRLASLEGLAVLQSLVDLDVSFNNLQSVEAQHLPPSLQLLNFGSNCIQQLSSFASLAHASHLTSLRVAGGTPFSPNMSHYPQL